LELKAFVESFDSKTWEAMLAEGWQQLHVEMEQRFKMEFWAFVDSFDSETWEAMSAEDQACKFTSNPSGGQS